MLLFIIALVLSLYYYSTRNHNYWTKRKVKSYTPIPLFGNIFRILSGIKSTTELATEVYNKYPEEKVVGYYKGITPVLVIRDLNLAKDILTTDFAYFYKRGLGRDIKKEPILDNIFHGEGDMWKLMRKRITHAFTFAKIKRMFPLIKECTQKLERLVGEILLKGGECDMRDLMARYSMEFIAVCGFGIETETMIKENTLFTELGAMIFERPLQNLIIMALWELFPEVRGTFKIMNPRIEETANAIVQGIRKHRNNKPSGRNDFIDQLLELEAMGKIETESIEKVNEDGSPIRVEMEIKLRNMTANVILFFGAGFETSSNSASFTLHQLALHPEIQKDIQDELDAIFLKYDNELTHDAIAEMHLLSMAFKEALRMLPPIGILHRECTKKYYIPSLGFTIDPSVKIIIPIQAIQMDPKYFDNPTKFQPERFKAINRNDYNDTYLPFGSGPRRCIGERLGYIESMAGLASILHKFTVEPSPNTKPEPELDHRKNTVQCIQGGLPLRIKRRTL